MYAVDKQVDDIRIPNPQKFTTYDIFIKNELLEKALDAMESGVVITDANLPDNPIIYCNKEFERLTGYLEQEVIGKNCRFLQADERDQAPVQKLANLMKAGKEGEVILRNYRKDGTSFWNKLKISPFRNSEGAITHFIGIQNDVTEEIETRRKLEEQQERYKIIAENSTDMISMHAPDEQYTYTYVSPSSERMIGYKPEELVGHSPFETMHPDDFEIIKDSDDFPFEREGRITFRKKTRAGLYKWTESLIRPIREGETGEIVEILAVTRDITEQKKYEQKLQHEKEFSDTIINAMPVNFYMIDKDMKFCRWNKALEQSLGYSAREIANLNPLESYDEKDHGLVCSKIDEALQKGQTELEVDIFKKNREKRRFYITGKRFETEQGMYILGASVDISERVQVEKQLRESEKRWEQLVNENPNLVQLTDEQFRIKFVNPAGARLYGEENFEGLQGYLITDLITFQEQLILKKRAKQILNGELLPPKIYSIITADGEERSIELHSVPVEYHDECVLLTVGQDVTDWAKYEKKLRQSLREKEVLLQEIHHRVKNNLAVVSGLLQIQRFNTEQPEVQRILTNSEMRIKSMALIHEKLYQSSSLSEIKLCIYIEDLVEYFREGLTSAHKISIEFECDEIMLNINQAVPCGLILNELLSNALEHAFPESENGVIQIHITEKNKQISVSISDNGIGLPDDGIKQKGMGFTIVETLCHQLDSSLEISDDGGTVFSFSFEQNNVKGSVGNLIA